MNRENDPFRQETPVSNPFVVGSDETELNFTNKPMGPPTPRYQRTENLQGPETVSWADTLRKGNRPDQP
jgi:hypothetical protein